MGHQIILGSRNDLWVFQSSQWTWISGSNSTNASTVINSTKNIDSPNNSPGSRNGATSWTDQQFGDLWLFGGFGNNNVSGESNFNYY